MILPFSFGVSTRQLFGIFHPRADKATPRHAVLLCNPFGQEAIPSHRVFRVLAERLARGGSDVLRFDYFGTGDSMGDDADVSLSGWTDDVVTAHQELRARSGASDIVWVGMRLGAVVALRAAARGAPALKRLVLWDPIVNGRQYLTHLRERHVSALEGSFNVLPQPRPRLLANNPESFNDEAMGFALPLQMRSDLADVEFIAELSRASQDVVVICDPQTQDGQALRASVNASAGLRAQIIDAPHGTDWTSDVAINTSVVPPKALQLLNENAGRLA